MENNVNNIKESYLCYGCGLCTVVCPKEAITMKYDAIGRLMPDIDDSKCVNCGLCANNCSSLDKKGIQLPIAADSFVGNFINVYIGKSKDDFIYKNGQSGGVVTSILKYLFDTGKIDGAIICQVDYYTTEYIPKAIVATSVSELYACQGSSYVPVDMISAVKEIKNLKSIAVVGTGCHIEAYHALESFKSKYRDIITYKLGLICDRTLCRTVTNVLEKDIFKTELRKIVWRDKSKDYKRASLKILTNKGTEKELPRWQRMVLKDPFTNPRCRICFDKLAVHADIVLGDPWGMEGVNWKYGDNVVITRTAKGQETIEDMIKDSYINVKHANIESLLSGQHIGKRKDTVSCALRYYLDNNWLIPTYSSSLGISSHINGDLYDKITCFVKDTMLSKNEIIHKNIELLRKEHLKHTPLYQLLIRSVKYPFKFFRKTL